MFTPRLLRIDKIVKDAGFGGSCPVVVEAENGARKRGQVFNLHFL